MRLLQSILLVLAVVTGCAMAGGPGGGGSGDAGITGVAGNDPFGYGGNFSATGGDADAGFADAAFGTQGSNSGFADANSPTPSVGGGLEATTPLLSGKVANSMVAKGVALALTSVPMIGTLFGALTAAGAFNGDADGDVSAAAAAGTGPGGLGGPGGDWTMRYGSNPNVQKTGLTGQPAQSSTGQDTGEVKKRGRSETLMTGPLGILGKPTLEKKALLQRGLREDLG